MTTTSHRFAERHVTGGSFTEILLTSYDRQNSYYHKHYIDCKQLIWKKNCTWNVLIISLKQVVKITRKLVQNKVMETVFVFKKRWSCFYYKRVPSNKSKIWLLCTQIGLVEPSYQYIGHHAQLAEKLLMNRFSKISNDQRFTSMTN